MSKLRLTDIKKAYHSGEIVHALKGVSLAFRENELVSILGPSGCGKTTLLNIIGGLDRYDEGDLSLGGKSTKHFKDGDWDAYRNHSVGFVFQNYNLISHQSVLQNVEIALTLSGVSVSERRAKARQALESVGLGDKLKMRPNQLSGGQMQRVAIARALVNDPDIILADEPTGALDSSTSGQVMDILKNISKSKLVIMVTHNRDLAEKYSSRIIQLHDGEVQSDSNPLDRDNAGAGQSHLREQEQAGVSGKLTLSKTSMSLLTATSLSFKNLLTKKGRTLITSFAGSIGIIGVALVLALSTGLSSYISTMQSETLTGFPLTVTEGIQMIQGHAGPPPVGSPFGDKSQDDREFPSGDVMYRYDKMARMKFHENILTEDFFAYIAKMEQSHAEHINALTYGRSVEMNVLAKGGQAIVKYSTSADSGSSMMVGLPTSSTYWQELPDNEDFIFSQYELIGEGSRYPQTMNEIALVVDSFNQVEKEFFDKLGMAAGEHNTDKLSDFIGKTILKVLPNNRYYTESDNGLFLPATADQYESLYNDSELIPLTITGVLRLKKDNATTTGYLSEGLVYTNKLTEYIVKNAEQSAVALAQKNVEHDVLLGAPFGSDAAKKAQMRYLGADTTPSSIQIFPKDFTSKDKIKQYLDEYNEGKAEDERIIYTDLSEVISSVIQGVLDTVSYVLIGFAAISLVVSTIMIGIITYVSVLERTKEIGILRSIGARKKDISRVFNAETLIVGLVAGVLGISIAYLLTLIINQVIAGLVNIEGLAQLAPVHALALVLGSMALTLLAGLIPAKAATKKDPVIALRTE